MLTTVYWFVRSGIAAREFFSWRPFILSRGTVTKEDYLEIRKITIRYIWEKKEYIVVEIV